MKSDVLRRDYDYNVNEKKDRKCHHQVRSHVPLNEEAFQIEGIIHSQLEMIHDDHHKFIIILPGGLNTTT